VLFDTPVVIRAESDGHKLFQEETFTVSVSAHGALVLLASKVDVGQKVVVMNPNNWDEREGRVAYTGREYAGLAQVAVEFAKPAPEFWAVGSPPADWHAA